MRFFASLAGATALALALPAIAEPGGNKGGGKPGAERSAPAQGGAKSEDRGKGQARGNESGGRADKRPPGSGNDRRQAERAASGPDKRPASATARAGDPRGKPPAARHASGRIDRATPQIVKSKGAPDNWRGRQKRERDAIVRIRDVRDIPFTDRRFDRRIVDGRGLIAGCPPGLAKKRNGCTPPGLAAQRNDWLDWRYRDLYRSGYRYGDGYLYRMSGGRIANYIPLLGGALFAGNAYPVDYFDYPAPAYYGAYYGGNDDYLYRYADGGVFAVDPDTQLIQAIVGLVTGNDWTVGQAMPAGYDVYNVPPPYRDRYFDSPDRWYRYDDGYVYGVDPQTQLITTAFSLLS